MFAVVSGRCRGITQTVIQHPRCSGPLIRVLCLPSTGANVCWLATSCWCKLEGSPGPDTKREQTGRQVSSRSHEERRDICCPCIRARSTQCFITANETTMKRLLPERPHFIDQEWKKPQTFGKTRLHLQMPLLFWLFVRTPKAPGNLLSFAHSSFQKIHKMPTEPDPQTKRCLLDSCQSETLIHGSVLGKSGDTRTPTLWSEIATVTGLLVVSDLHRREHSRWQ